ncbi:MAG: hypothetical protein B5766_04210 [Candidatus Lumbricidophila eiseniae]|uniref:Glycosyl hydrolase n=1 Tax=Candidatus Lumbricidiphila eiseniae TaxID=1969409 RepID=A0A2A6FST9_9MICO|nr:MAG: hypothetical protein B5766_04210 [Candidatus Lumbricidophila eiseniae]
MPSVTFTTTPAPVLPSRGTLRPLGLNEVRITGGFWGRRQELNHDATLTHIGNRLESEGWLSNFDLAAAGMLPQGRRGAVFADSEVYKYLEALAWEIARSGSERLEGTFRSIVTRVAAAQEPDGYLNTSVGRTGQIPRWSDLEWGHELYCLGHLFQAAVARVRTRPDADDGLVQIARRAADLVCEVFGNGGIESVCGHPVVEVGLVELGRALTTQRYAHQARLFIERRGRRTLNDIEWSRKYFQDDVSVRDTEVLHGHAVRANYLAAGAVDVAIETGDEELLASLRQQWSHTIARRTYLTGGQGSHHQDEAFGEDWELPSDRAYSETCAGIGSIMFSWRLLLASGEPVYADLIERTLYNVVAAALSRDGRSFYYTNTLHQRVPGTPADPDRTWPRASSSLRAPWFEVSCCPPNIARTLASLDAYVASVNGDGVQLHQYAPAEVRTHLEDGQSVQFDVDTVYPENGRVLITIRSDSSQPWNLSLRVPAWAYGTRLRVQTTDGESEEKTVEPGIVSVRRAFRAGDHVELTLPMQPRISKPDPRIDAIRQCVAIERGPLVLAVESVDLATSDDVSAVAIDLRSQPHERDGRVWISLRIGHDSDRDWPYGTPDGATAERAAEVPLIPYYDRANRGLSTMRIWLPVLEPC